ncbi:unnamed protein product [Caenorhabditis auriculariae]|uniref:Uncharacterized protein n=1 Tax=Caenorhabditis auriculariae TaxID=2777116 RepID=A0A8S1H8G9_9PELO|nr:unnamed protein product [Caenorhabditis auriculariae]
MGGGSRFVSEGRARLAWRLLPESCGERRRRESGRTKEGGRQTPAEGLPTLAESTRRPDGCGTCGQGHATHVHCQPNNILA